MSNNDEVVVEIDRLNKENLSQDQWLTWGVVKITLLLSRILDELERRAGCR